MRALMPIGTTRYHYSKRILLGSIPIVTVTPMAPTILSSTALGTTVATITVTMTDGSTFSGTVIFAPPYYDDGGIYSISGSSSPFDLIVDPDGPGVGSEGGSVDDVSIIAVQ